MNNNKNNGILYIVIGILICLVVSMGSFIVYDNFVNKDENNQVDNNDVVNKEDDIPNNNENNNVVNKEDDIPNNNENENNNIISYSYQNYDIKLLDKIKNINNIYAVEVRVDKEGKNNEIFIKYIDESELKIATIITKDNIELEYRTLDLEDNKLYFIISSKNQGPVFELYCIDLNNLESGTKRLDDFNTIFIKDNTWDINGKIDIYPSKIFVKENDIYYTSLKDKSLKKYNMISEKTTTVSNNVDWFDIFIDKINNKIFYYNNNKLYLSDLNGNNQIELDSNLYDGSEFWTNAYFNKLPLFATIVNASIDNAIYDLYVFDYKTNSFVKISENIDDFSINYNSIDNKNNDSNYIVNKFFVK